MSHFVWYDLMTPDMKGSADFYGHVVGWSIADGGMPGMDYSIIKANGIDVGGMMPPPPSTGDMPPMWNGYIYSADVDASAKQAETLGGSVFQAPMDIPGVGRFAVIADPSGATFIIFKPSTDAEPTVVPDGTPGHIGWRELHSGDWRQAWDFYSSLFGWSKGEAMDMGPMGTYQQFKVGDKSIGGMMTKRSGDPSPPNWKYYFNVDSIEAATARAKAKGAKIFVEPMQVPGGQWIIMAMDPQGAMFCLVSTLK
jgi:uncharacterized protein